MSKFDQLMEGRAPKHTPAPRLDPEFIDKPAPAPERRRVGRPPGKRSNEGFKQVGVLLDVKLYERCMRRLLSDTLRPDFSNFVNERMREWLGET